MPWDACVPKKWHRKLCVSLCGPQVALGLSDGINYPFFEIRLDSLKNDLIQSNSTYGLFESAQFASVATFRKGTYAESMRMEALMCALKHGASMVDLDISEADSFVRKISDIVNQNQAKLIISMHNHAPSLRYDECDRIRKKAQQYHADYLKFATVVNTQEDCAELLEFLDRFPNTIIASLGPLGLQCRALALAKGAAFTYVAPHENALAMVGQPTLQSMLNILEASP